MNNKEDIANYELSLLAKELGFDWETEFFYSNEKEPFLNRGLEYQSDSYVRWWKWNNQPDNYPTQAKDVLCAAPTLYMLQKWLREKHKIYVQVNLTHGSKYIHYYPIIFDFNVHRPKEKNLYNVIFYIREYVDALKKGLLFALKYIQNNYE